MKMQLPNIHIFGALLASSASISFGTLGTRLLSITNGPLCPKALENMIISLFKLSPGRVNSFMADLISLHVVSPLHDLLISVFLDFHYPLLVAFTLSLLVSLEGGLL